MHRAPEIESFVRSLYDGMASGDLEEFAQRFSRDALGIGTDPNEWWTGEGALARAFVTQLTEMRELGDLRIDPGDLQGYREGSIGWAADRPTLAIGDMQIPSRISLVCHQEGGAWKVVHWHISIGVTNEEAIGEELTV